MPQNFELADTFNSTETKLPKRLKAEMLNDLMGNEHLSPRAKNPPHDRKDTLHGNNQTLGPCGVGGETYENPKYLAKLVETLGTAPIDDYGKKLQWQGGALAYSDSKKD